MNKDVLEHIEDTVRDIMPLDARILLFGSRARGDARPDSDWDILIILKVNELRDQGVIGRVERGSFTLTLSQNRA